MVKIFTLVTDVNLRDQPYGNPDVDLHSSGSVFNVSYTLKALAVKGTTLRQRSRIKIEECETSGSQRQCL